MANKNKEITTLLNRLAELGGEAFKEPDNIGYWEKIGMAISFTSDDVKGVYRLANSMAEDWNYHAWANQVDEMINAPYVPVKWD